MTAEAAAPKGLSLPHDSAQAHVTGQARYVDDIPLPADCLHLAFGQSSVARGRITAIDLTAVRAAPGVVAAWSADDLRYVPDCSPSLHDEPLLATGAVHFLGQPVFLVAATSHRAARRAARLAEIRYEEAPPILTIDQALAANSRFEQGPVIWSRGDAGAAIASAPHQIEGQFEVGGQEHFYLEGQAALALPQEDGMTIHASTQHPTEIQHKVAEALHLPMAAVRVEMRRMGGGFGGKESQGNWLAVACAITAQRLRRPAKMRYDRDDDFTITGKRHDLRIGYRAGLDDQGRILGVEFTHLFRCGWSMDLSLPVADRAMLHADNAYFLPAIRIESHRLRTNTQSATAFRGFGGPQGVIGIERVLDHGAHRLGLDPLLIRQRNYYPESGHPTAPARAEATPYGMEVTDFILGAMTEDLQKSCQWQERQAAIADWNSKNPTIKRGLGFSPVKFGISFTLTHLNQAGALVHLYQDGSVVMNHGGTEMGQGLHRKLSQVAAEAFGLNADAIRISATDTAKVPNTSATAASSGADLNGMAVLDACNSLRARLAEFLAARAGVNPEDVRFVQGRVQAGALDLAWETLIAEAYQARISLSATGFYATPKIRWDRLRGQGRPFLYFAYGAAVTEVALDVLTGEYRILRADIVHDCGNSLNPALDIGQIEGAYVQGAGWLTTEELVWDDKGRLRTHAPSTYKIPAFADPPRAFHVRLWDQPNREATVHRSKAVGEPPFMHGISAFLALSAACAACGPAYPSLDAPATPERVLAAIARARAGQRGGQSGDQPKPVAHGL